MRSNESTLWLGAVVGTSERERLRGGCAVLSGRTVLRLPVRGGVASPPIIRR